MESRPESRTADREYWLRVLAAGGTTTVARWATDPRPGFGEHTEPIPAALLARLAAHDSGALSRLLLTAHARVLAALSGERDVVVSYVGPAGQSLPLALATEAGSWHELLVRTGDAERELLRHADFAVDGLLTETGLTGPRSEAVFSPAGAACPQPGPGTDPDVVLWADVTEVSGQPALRLRYRTDSLDDDAAARIGGYHLAALTKLITEPAGSSDGCLLSERELAFQFDGLAGPERELPQLRFHELFEQRAGQHPDAVAAVLGDTSWSYRELNGRANQIARGLLVRGLRREGVVAVATERNLDWMASIIAIFKAGGVYLPIEPHLPGDRIAGVLTRAECAIVLTEQASSAHVDEALTTLPDVQRVFVDDIYEAGHGAQDLRIPVDADQLAYIYFTSGSTGEPKGAMCEHAGMINHLQAKIADLEIGEGQVVAQTAPQSFDISLWQLISALLVGGRTQLIEQEVILDVARFVEKIADGRVNVMQLVPSYLEVVLTYLEQNPRELPDLHCASATGEALKLELAQRWFSVMPGVKMVNAYGLTETSDDTNHEVMRSAPSGRSVPLGPAVQNVRVYVVDERFWPVPLGAPGQIVFSGVCVGRGYINDPDRTAAAYLTDPHRPGERLYQAGDFGRWRQDGKLEFLGRRDSQVKISGFRIEIGEIENTLLRVPGVRDGAVVVAEQAGRKQLVAFYAAEAPIPVEVLKQRLSESLPVYMVPPTFHHRDALPLTANSKIDKKALTKLAAELDVPEQAGAPLETPTEHRLAQAWAKVLGVPVDQIGRDDHFFERGGNSLSAVKVAIALKREVSLRDITRAPVLADLAAMIDGRTERQSGLLQALTEPAPTDAGLLVCFPYAGGNAVNFQPMATALRGSGIAVHAVELPGHDLAAEREPFAPAEQVVAQVVEQVGAELKRRGLQRVLLWGHSSGTALAVATAAALHDRGVDVARLFVAAQLPGTADGRRSAAVELGERSDAEIAQRLSSDSGYTALGELDAQRAEHVGAAYRHDVLGAHQFFATALGSATPIEVPVTVVVAADDPSTAGYQHRYAEWERLAEHVELVELAEGGHYFLRTRPAEAAGIVRNAVEILTSR